MSGFAAVVRFDGAPIHQGKLSAMMEAIGYRGPDGANRWNDERTMLGHLMLHTTTESLDERQPLANEDESVILVMDGWLANPVELRDDLISRGAVLRDRTDAELVLRAFEAWGLDCPRHIDGEYAIVLWDRRRQKVICARDHAGMRPLHYHWDGKRLLVASDLAGILAAGDFEHLPNRDMIAEHLANAWYSRDETLWQGVMRLLPAHTLEVTSAGPRLHRFWRPPFDEELRYPKDEDYYDHYRDLLADCVKKSSRSHLPLSCEVSGGLDSSGVFATAHFLNLAGQLGAPGLSGYTYNFGEQSTPEVDEIEFARAVAEHLGVHLHEVPPFLPELEWFLNRGQLDRDMPPYPNNAMSTNIGRAVIKNGGRVVLNGEGGDEFLYGSAMYYADQIISGKWRDFLECLAADRTALGLSRAVGLIARQGVAKALPLSIRRLRRRWGRPVLKDRFGSGYDWLSPDLRRRISQRASRSDQEQLDKIASPSRRGMFMSLQDGFLGYAHEYISRNSAREGYELRSPMYARDFMEFAFRIPAHLRMRGGRSKFLHVQALRGMLPEKVLHRRSDVSFGLPFERLLDTVTEPMLTGMLRCKNDLVDNIALERLAERYRLPIQNDRARYELWGVVGCNNLFEHCNIGN